MLKQPKMLTIFVINIMALMASLSAQPDTLWTKTFGGSSSDYGRSVQQTSDSGYIITGSTRSYGAGGSDVWLIKTDASGDTVWTKTFGGEYTDYGASVQKTSDGGYIITGSTTSYGAGLNDVWLIKTDASGDTVWTKTFGGSNRDYGSSVQQTSDGGYIVTGYTKSYGEGTASADVWLIKTDASGYTLWTRTFGGRYYDELGQYVRQTLDGGYIITGYNESDISGDNVLLIKTDASGYRLWTKTFRGENDDYGRSVQQTSDGGYIITGSMGSYSGVGGIQIGAGGDDVWLIKTDSNGEEEWNKTFGGSENDQGYSVQQTSDGGYIITGLTVSYGAGDSDFWLIKTDASGNTLWTKTFGGSSNDGGYSVQQTTDGGYIITGNTVSYSSGADTDVWLIRLAADGAPVTILEQDFDSEQFPPDGWTTSITNSDNTWQLGNPEGNSFSVIDSTNQYSAFCPWVTADQDEWLITPEFSLRNGDAFLNFYAGYSTQWLANATLKLHISQDGGSTWTELWEADDDGQSWSWRQNAIDLSAYAGIYSLKLAWQYEGNDGDLVAIDSLVLAGYLSISDDRNVGLPTRFVLHPNYPNPFNPYTKIRYDLSEQGHVSIVIYDILGRHVKTLVNRLEEQGIKSITWDGTNDFGRPVSAGVYLYQIRASDFIQTRKMLLLK